MDEVAQALGRALGVDATQGRFVLQMHDRCATAGADRGHRESLAARQPGRNANDLGDDVPRFAHLDGIANANAEVCNDIAVVQTGAGNAGARQENRVKHCCRRQYAGAADGDFNITDDTLFDFGRILECNRPARELVRAAQRAAGGQVVDLDDCAVNVKFQRAAGFADGFNFFDGVLDILKHAVPR